MALKWLIFAALASMAFADDSCPSQQEIAPCTCDGEGLNCMLAKSLQDIRKAFRANFKYNALRSVWIQGLGITNIPSDLFGSIKSQQFYIEMNDVASVDLGAFNASKRSLQVLSLFGNRISTLPFQEFGSYERLSTLNLAKNQISTIPANAFSSSSLHILILAQNRISSIGENAFSNLPNLGSLQLFSNYLTKLGPYSLAFRSNLPQLQIQLAANRISEISSTAFSGTTPQVLFLSSNQLKSLPKEIFNDLVVRMANAGGFIEVTGNPFSCRGCDYSWLVLNKRVLADKFRGFRCTNGIGLDQLTNQAIGC